MKNGSVYAIDWGDSLLKGYREMLKWQWQKGIFVEGEWVTHNGRRVLWLPPEYRPTCTAAWGNMLIMGHSSGRHTTLWFNV
jgi:hypothetical protein